MRPRLDTTSSFGPLFTQGMNKQMQVQQGPELVRAGTEAL